MDYNIYYKGEFEGYGFEMLFVLSHPQFNLQSMGLVVKSQDFGPSCGESLILILLRLFDLLC